MTGRLKVYDADTATWKYVDAPGEQVELLKYVPLDPAIALSGLPGVPATTITANTGVIDTPTIGGIPANAVAVSLQMHARHSVVTASHRFNVYAYGTTTIRSQLISGKVVNHYEALTCHYVELGGDRKFTYEVQIGAAGTTVYDATITGYWLKVQSAAVGMGGGNVVGKGTAFPLSPALYDQFFRTDIGMEFMWTGVRWASTVIHQYRIGNAETGNLAATDNDNDRTSMPLMPPGCTDIWWIGAGVGYHVTAGTALSASHKWTCFVGTSPISGYGAGGAMWTKTIDSGASAIYRRDPDEVIDVLQSSIATRGAFLYLNLTKTGTPGNLYFLPTLTFRYVAT